MDKFVSPEDIIAQVELKKGQKVADFGCGGGYYTIAAARFVGDHGHVYAVDIMPDRLVVTQSAAQHRGLKNVSIIQQDLEAAVTTLPPAECDVVIVSNILHQVNAPEAVLRNVYLVLKTGGEAVVVEWKRCPSLFGPPQSSRITRDKLMAAMQAAGLQFVRDLEADGYHYAAVFRK